MPNQITKEIAVKPYGTANVYRIRLYGDSSMLLLELDFGTCSTTVPLERKALIDLRDLIDQALMLDQPVKEAA